MPTSGDFELLRSPSELREYVSRLKDEVSADEEERCLGIQKKGLYKEFLDEILPLSYFAIQVYPETYRVGPVLGNQGYDAIVYDENGREVDRVEITAPHDGMASAADAKLQISRGYGAVTVATPGDDFDALFQHVLGTCQKKALKDYSGCSLVISIAPMEPFRGFEANYESQVASLVNEIAKIEFKAKRIFLLILPDRLKLIPRS
jgi:hypothetical protein